MRFLPWAVLGFLLASCGGGDAPGARLQPQAAQADAASFPGARSNYTVSRSGDGWRVTDHATGAHTDVSATAGSLAFVDLTVNLAIEAKAATISAADLKLLIELYIAFFNRTPDADGLAFWIDQSSSGRSIDSIADDFYAAAVQYSSLTGYSAAMTNADFVRIIYGNVLGRSGSTAPPDEDVSFWAGQLASGKATRGSLIRVMLGSAHTFKGDATWGWVADLLDNKWRVGRYFAVTQGLNYNTPSDSIARGMATAAAVTPGDIAAAVRTIAPSVDRTSWKVTTPTTRSLLASEVSTIPPNPYLESFATPWRNPRAVDFADFNGDGLPDMFLAPGYIQYEPVLRVQVWLNNGDGTFRNGTAEVFEGLPPLVWNATQIIFADFNEDGRPDVFIVDSGPERAGIGYHNTLILSQPGGKYANATSNIANNGVAFNHMGDAGDTNGDGHLDIVWNAIPPGASLSRGIKLAFGDGEGGFTDETARLPMEIRWMSDDDRIAQGGPSVLKDFQNAGCAALVDLDGDGKAEVIVGSYAIADGYDKTGTRTLRVFKLRSSGNFTEAARMSIPAALAVIPDGSGTPGRGLGCSQVVAADFHGTGRKDMLVLWEGAGTAYIELLRNDGGLRFTDVTLQGFGTYDETFTESWASIGVGHYRIADVNGDGKPDLVAQLPEVSLASVVPHIAWLNDGSGRFTRWSPEGPQGPLSAADLQTAAKCATCPYMPFMFDTTGSGIASLLLMDFQSLRSGGTPQQTTGVYLTVFEPAGFR